MTKQTDCRKDGVTGDEAPKAAAGSREGEASLSQLRGYERRDAICPSVDRRERKATQQPDYQSCNADY